ncbi:MAG: hypothetical protein DPW14_17220 [Planctomycetes bacterium]|nr:hypothetical protein [Planctomycetota bacterium]
MPDNMDQALHKWLDGLAQPKGNDIGIPANHPLAGADVVSGYPDDDAIEDGFLIDITQEVNDVAKCRVKRWLMSRALFEAVLVPKAEKVGERDGEPILDVRKALVPLLEAFQQAVNKAGAAENEYWWFDVGLAEQVKACHDGHGRITLCFPSDD